MEFNLAEKLAIVKVIDSVIHADGVIHGDELRELTQLMKIIDFDSNFIVHARNIDSAQGLMILSAMTNAKKKELMVILKEMAEADGFVHEKETELLLSIFSSIGIK